MKKDVEFNVTVSFIREGDAFIAYAPALDLSTSGKSLKQAKKRFKEALDIFIEETSKQGTLEEALLERGWKKTRSSLQPPVVVGHEEQTIHMPVKR